MEFIESISSKESKQINTQVSGKSVDTVKRKVQTWTKKEDNQLMDLYQKFPKKWTKIASMMDSRNQNQCLHRYMRLNKIETYSKEWSTAQDELTLKLIKQYGKNWKIISEKMGTKSGKQIKERFINKLEPQIQFKSKEGSRSIEENQHKFASKLSSKSSKQFKNRMNCPQNIYSSQKTLPTLMTSTQLKHTVYQESVSINKFANQQINIEYRQKSAAIQKSQVYYSHQTNKLQKDDYLSNLNERNYLVSSNTLRIQDMSEQDQCIFFSRQYE